VTVLGEGCPGVLDSKEFRALVIFAASFSDELRIRPQGLRTRMTSKFAENLILILF
jgi:hypothetical protein